MITYIQNFKQKFKIFNRKNRQKNNNQIKLYNRQLETNLLSKKIIKKNSKKIKKIRP